MTEPENPEQYKRFLEKAKELRCEDFGRLGDVLKPDLMEPPKPRAKKF